MLAAIALMATSCADNFKKTKSGLLYKIIPGKKGDALKPGQVVKFQVIGKMGDSVFYETYGRVPAYNMVDSVGRPYDVSEIFKLLRVGDSAVVVQSMDTLSKIMGGAMPGTKKGEKRKIFLRVIGSFSDITQAQNDFNNELELQKEREVQAIEAHLQKNKINAVKTQKGVYVQVLKKGEGALPDSGKQVSIKYTGKSFKGVAFDSNVDSSFGHTDPLPLTIGQMGSIPGFEEGVRQFAKGGKGVIFIPSMLACGQQGAPPRIQSFENLIFEIEVLDIKDAPKVPEMPPMPSNAQGNGGNQ